MKTPVAELADARGLPLLQPARIGEVAGEISRCDVLVVAAYGQILRPDTLYAAANGALNVHASLLPKYRGAAPIERSIMAGETETGVSIMRMDEGLDTGPVALQRKTPLGPDTTGGELTAQLAELGAEVMVEALRLLERNELTFEEQDSSRASHAAKISAEEREIFWERSSSEVHDLVRALSPRIGARTHHPEASGPIKILRTKKFARRGVKLRAGEISMSDDALLAGCGEGILEVLELQMPGGRPLGSREFLRGHRLSGGFVI